MSHLNEANEIVALKGLLPDGVLAGAEVLKLQSYHLDSLTHLFADLCATHSYESRLEKIAEVARAETRQQRLARAHNITALSSRSATCVQNILKRWQDEIAIVGCAA